MKEIICLIGPSGSGKSTVAQWMYKNKRFMHISSSQFINTLKKDIKKISGVEYKNNELIAAISLLWPGGFNDFMAKNLKNLPFDHIVWDSCINMSNLELVLDNIDQYERSLGLGDLMLLSDWCIDTYQTPLVNSMNSFFTECRPSSIAEKKQKIMTCFYPPCKNDILIEPCEKYLKEIGILM